MQKDNKKTTKNLNDKNKKTMLDLVGLISDDNLDALSSTKKASMGNDKS